MTVKAYPDRGGRHVIIKVIDNGSGMTPEQLAAVAQPNMTQVSPPSWQIMHCTCVHQQHGTYLLACYRAYIMPTGYAHNMGHIEYGFHAV